LRKLGDEPGGYIHSKLEENLDTANLHLIDLEAIGLEVVGQLVDRRGAENQFIV
jgi:hypothetical protein